MAKSYDVEIDLSAAIVAVTDEVPRILTVRQPGPEPPSGKRVDPMRLEALPDGLLDLNGDLTLELGLRRCVRELSGLELGYVEQLYTFGDRQRDLKRGSRIRRISVAYLALLREGRLSPLVQARWQDAYAFFPWEDWRSGRPSLIDEVIEPFLRSWALQAASRTLRQRRRERVEITFGLGKATWDAVRVLERYELLYEAGLVQEAHRDRPFRESYSEAETDFGSDASGPLLGTSMALDHRRILSTALGRLRGKLNYRPLVFELLPSSFTLFQLQKIIEALAGIRLHKQNFRRLVEQGGLVEETGEIDTRTGGRPAKLYRFRREVLRERRAPGFTIPSVHSAMHKRS